MCQDEARFGRISDVRRCWAPKPLRPICQAMLTHEYTYAYSAVDVCSGELDSLILPHVNTECMQLFLDEVSARHPDEHIVMVIDGAGWHRSDGLKAPANIYLLKLPGMTLGIGLYLPMEISSAAFLGGLLNLLVGKFRPSSKDKGLVISSGLLGGEGIAGVLIAIIRVLTVS